ncbi:hypothetical protein CaCOL14_000534 [Colletotrichum acutatum]|uniref:Brix domain-containing protein n=2 Tax=Colletotrichum acutatum species complex TaxID=2707335 RepID=A0A010RH31_9PEZI|nr:uncharacterized protein COL516b_010974 [Colletotrichum fioriniae]XP_060368230.1 Brix domain-containing protein [Colletotrichum acutatum]EXF79671.1 brix domain-containing protein [Colletotrichum fioriniae PJ7]KAJ0297233.1 hypothetical protein COL516b_010974 [Colletotrichum fioriniae]KAJ0316092.1 hypothetical protein COL5a_011693 [Colletotrichum fioriniae]KAJ3943759.1 Ribosome biogenesis protein brx1 [Colletotrichum fioriniae]KAK1728175.1 Brix domain-containing protein [Colletotrichum acutat
MASVYKSLSKKADKPEAPTNGVKKVRQKRRALVLSSRGVTYRHRHLMTDIHSMMPHGKLDSKFDTKSKLHVLNELAELNSTPQICYLEARKHQDLYMWLANAPNGPSVRLHIQNIMTMEELRFPGNCLKGSRPILSFDSAFDTEPHLQVIKNLMTMVFGVPEGARKSKPFVDHVMGISWVDEKIWIRYFEVKEVDAETEEETGKSALRGGKTDVALVEIGPRWTATPIVILEGSMCGSKIWESRSFVSPNQIRADLRKKKSTRHVSRTEQEVERAAKRGELGLRSKGGKSAAKDELDTKALFA